MAAGQPAWETGSIPNYCADSYRPISAAQ